MKTLSVNVALLLALALVGCSGDPGPAKPEDTPVVTQEQMEKSMTSNPQGKAMYDKYKKGGS